MNVNVVLKQAFVKKVLVQIIEIQIEMSSILFEKRLKEIVD